MKNLAWSSLTSAPTPSAPISHWQPHAGSLEKIRRCLTFNNHQIVLSHEMSASHKLIYGSAHDHE